VLKLRDDQVADLSFYISQPKCGNWSDPGTGKTPSVCVNQYRRVVDTGFRTAWIGPKSLLPKNQLELTRFTPFTVRDAVIVDGTPAQIDRAMNSGARVFLMGPDRFRRIWKDLPFDVKAMDVDEFHMCFGGHSSQRTAGFYAFQERKAEESVFMSGTIVNGRLDTAYPAIHAIEPRYYPLGYDQFIGAHAYQDDFDRIVAWHNHERLGAILGAHGIRRTFESIFGKQAVVWEVQWCDMEPEQRQLYDTFERDALLELEHFMIDGTLPGVATTRARQIMEHPNAFPDLRDPDHKLRLPPVDIIPGRRPGKLEALAIHFEDHARKRTPVLVSAFFVPQQQQIAQVATSAGLRVGLINGETPMRERAQVDVAFQNGALDCVICSPACASVGYNWQWSGGREVGHVIFASLSYMDSDVTQFTRRPIREARTSPLRVTTLAYMNCRVEAKNMSIIERKSRDAHLVDPTRTPITFSSHKEVHEES
jgi:hypothetical protein